MSNLLLAVMLFAVKTGEKRRTTDFVNFVTEDYHPTIISLLLFHGSHQSSSDKLSTRRQSRTALGLGLPARSVKLLLSGASHSTLLRHTCTVNQCNHHTLGITATKRETCPYRRRRHPRRLLCRGSSPSRRAGQRCPPSPDPGRCSPSD